MSGTAYQTPVIDQMNAVSTEYWPVDEGYIPTLGMQLVSGRNFSEKMLTDSAAIILNESAARQLGANPIGKPIYRLADLRTQRMFKYTVIGIVRDFNFNSLRENITPVCLILSPNPGALSVRIQAVNTPAVIAQLQRKWKLFSPGEQLDYSFMDENFEASYRSEQRIGSISLTFTTLAIVIACLGLFGLAAYSAEQRNKEIGIRKVLGASVSGIVKMLSADFIKLVVISILIATPFAWWVMHSWLQGFAYRQEIHWWVLALAGAISTLIAFLTISFQSVKAAAGKPADGLRSE
jgi:putative ABC transport system permease protein